MSKSSGSSSATAHYRPETRLVHSGNIRSEFGETSEALFLTQGYVYDSAEQCEARFKGEESGYIYSRYSNPTTAMFERRMVELEGAEAGRSTATGMAAVTTAMLAPLKAGDHVVAAKAMFGASVKTRFYPSFFPFTEPSADMQISCFKCGGSGRLNGERCGMCKASGWIEILGSGMVDPNVYGFVDYDPKKYSGFAFGMGVERIAILKYGVDDIQLFYQGDVRFLKQFA